MEKAQESGEGSSPTERTADPELLVHVDSRMALPDQKPKSSVANEQSTLISNHILDIPPTPESVVAAVAAIVETNTLAPSENPQRIATEASTDQTHG